MAAALRMDDAAAVLGAVEDLSRAADRDDLIDRVLRWTGELIASDSCSFNWMAPGRLSALVRPAVEPDRFERLRRSPRRGTSPGCGRRG